MHVCLFVCLFICLMAWVRISIRVRCTTLCDKVCRWLATGRWFVSGSSDPVFSTNWNIVQSGVKHRYLKQTNKPFRGGVLNTTSCDKVCQWLAAGRWVSLGTPFISGSNTNHHDITEILLNVALNTITHSPTQSDWFFQQQKRQMTFEEFTSFV